MIEQDMTEATRTELQMAQIQVDLTDIKSSMGKIADALTRLAVLEERHTTVANTTNKILERIEKMEGRQRDSEITRQSFERMFARIESVENRVKALEEYRIGAEASHKTAMVGVKALWAVLGSGVIAVGGYLIMAMARGGA